MNPENSPELPPEETGETTPESNNESVPGFAETPEMQEIRANLLKVTERGLAWDEFVSDFLLPYQLAAEAAVDLVPSEQRTEAQLSKALAEAALRYLAGFKREALEELLDLEQTPAWSEDLAAKIQEIRAELGE